MEHQTLNAYGNKFRYTVSGGKDFDWLLLHEFGHEWWGNKVTVKDWADMWIQEGICSFGDRLYTLDYDGKEAYLNQDERDGQGNIEQTAHCSRKRTSTQTQSINMTFM